MAVQDMREQAYTAIDRLLLGLQNGTIDCFARVEAGVPHKNWFYFFQQTIDKYHLVGYKHWDTTLVTGILSLAEEGMKAIEIGGIREYIVTCDSTFRKRNGYPKLFIGSVAGNAKNKMFIYDEAGEKDIRLFYGDPEDTLIVYDTSDQEPEQPPVIQPPVITHTVINNHISGSVGNLQNNSGSIGTSNQVNEGHIIRRNVGMFNPNNEGPWTKWGVIIAVIVCIITAIGVYYAWLGLHPGK